MRKEVLLVLRFFQGLRRNRKTLKGHKKQIVITCLKKIFSFLFLLFFFKAEAQQIFQKIILTTNGGEGYSIIQTNDHGFLIAGVINQSMSQTDGLIIKTDSIGNVQWNKTIGNNYRSENFSKIIKTQDGNYVVLGSTGSCGPVGIDYSISPINGDTLPYNISVLKIDSTGTILWSYCYGDTLDDWGADIIEDNNGDLIILGTINNTVPLYDNGGDAVLLRLDPNGILKWSKKIYSQSGFLDFGNNLCKGPDGGFYISGGIVDYAGPSIGTCYILRTDSMGTIIWSKLIEDTISSYAYNKMTYNNNGGAIFAFDGFTTSNTSGSPDIFILNFDSSGILIWSKKYGNSSMGGNSIMSILTSNNVIWAVDANNEILLKIDLLTGDLLNISFNFIPSISTSIASLIKKDDNGITLIGSAGIAPDQIFLGCVDSSNTSCTASSFIYPFQNFNVPIYNFIFLDSISYLQVDSMLIENLTMVTDSTYCLTFTNTVEVTSQNYLFKIYPNPFSQEINIYGSEPLAYLKIRVYDLSGRIVYANQIQNGKVPLNFLLNGLYFINIDNGKKNWYYKIQKSD